MTVAGSLHLPAGSLASSPWLVALTPEDAAWTYAGLRVADLQPGDALSFDTGPDEVIVLPLHGSFRVSSADETVVLDGRPNVFAGPSDFAYAPPGVGLTIASPQGGQVAVPSARAEARHPFRRVAAADVRVERRGAGPASRDVRTFATPGAFDADRLIASETLTPGGHWSSYPPHKHDERGPAESALEEIYYYLVADGPSGPGIAYQRVYASPSWPVDVLVEVRSGDVVLVPGGWHGPSMAAPGYDLYYLNVMAGPGPERIWRVTVDPGHAWVMETWPEPSGRLPR